MPVLASMILKAVLVIVRGRLATKFKQSSAETISKAYNDKIMREIRQKVRSMHSVRAAISQQ